MENKIEDLEHLINFVEWAKQHGLQIEFLDTFIEQIKLGKSIRESYYFSNYEWDL